MDSSPLALFLALAPKAPFILKTALRHSLSLSPTSSKWDLRTEITINLLRDMINAPPQPVSKTQKMTVTDPGVKGKVWVTKVKCPVVEEDDVRQLLFKAIRDMETGEEQWVEPENQPLEAEWNGYRAGAKDGEPEPSDLSDKEKYDKLIAETTSKVTMLYFHGGAMYLLDPATHRPTTSKIARETGGRVFSVRYRLSPQHPFPSALLDCFTAYLTLLSPPPGALHDPIPANEIVFGGDSAGGTCCSALLQLLLQLHRSYPPGQIPTVRFNGRSVPIPLPAGMAMTSPWFDISRSLPSIEDGTTYDYLPPPSVTAKRHFPPDEIWPAKPPRAEMYCETSAILHPLVSPLAAPDWSASPPLFFSVGQEMLYDENAVLAQRAAGQGVKVRWREFEAMPHCFAMLLDSLEGSRVHYEEYGRFCREIVAGNEVRTDGELIEAKTLNRKEMKVRELTEISEEQVRGHMEEGKKWLERKMQEDGGVGAKDEPVP